MSNENFKEFFDELKKKKNSDEDFFNDFKERNCISNDNYKKICAGFKKKIIFQMKLIKLCDKFRKRNSISDEDYQNFCTEFKKRKCKNMKDWLKKYNLADVEPFVEALEKEREQYYKDNIDLLKDAVSISGISMNYVINESLKKWKKPPGLYAPGGCNNPEKCIKKCKCDKTKAYKI